MKTTDMLSDGLCRLAAILYEAPLHDH
ncbi:TPA: protein YrbN [Morganella morganii]|uniref:Protein YrbN n=1 Tax=Morganella morganii TaxID=582 RepID=A0AAI9MRY0_MORMO|nr:protein YrbN [Morganella morganii]EBQ6113550.1 protein YrbN [Salmonella enterica subsp. enterica serovar Enteritidis]EBV1760478.1 protein YrbN [Salmonella enterica subsp. enterica serovar Newport]EBX6937347.1 protein YrbN [Salmonella enterica subsp. enterica serovar Bareilly]MBS9543781.1 protein YrbN [Morganella morganii subsp. morganii]MCJ1905330.1 protein YrbN [Morganella sp. HSTU-ASny43]HAE78695.1 protein YrbN [Morganella sp. (in: enterobacteria)]HAS8351622.1 protein YrbN [Vibrio vulni